MKNKVEIGTASGSNLGINGVKLYTRNILILEAHLDDFEIGMSVWLQKMGSHPTRIDLITFCKGRESSESLGDSDEKNKKRMEYRLNNLKLFKKLYPNIEIINHVLNFTDTSLENVSINHILKEVYAFPGIQLGQEVNLYSYKEVYFTQGDLHPDHTKVNQIGKILTRNYKGRVFEYIITNSGYISDTSKINTEIKAEYRFKDEKYSEKYIYPCLFPTEKTSLQQILYGQKAFDGKFISDKFNLIKDVFVTGN